MYIGEQTTDRCDYMYSWLCVVVSHVCFRPVCLQYYSHCPQPSHTYSDVPPDRSEALVS